MTTMPSREEVVLALASFGWVVWWLWPQPVAVAIVGVSTATGMLVTRRRPRLAAALVLGAGALAALLGVPSENPATLLPCAIVAYGLGRRAGIGAGLLGLLGFVVPPTWSDGGSGATLVFGVFLYGVFWGFGRLVAAKTARAEGARAIADLVGAQDPQRVAEIVVAEERSRLAADIVAVVGDCVRAMVADAEAAEGSLAPERIERIRVRGATGVTELRRMLGLLREDPVADPPTRRLADVPNAARRVPVVGLATAAALLVLTGGELAAMAPQPPTAALVLVALLPLTVVLRGRRAVGSALVATAALCLVGLIQPVPLGLGPGLVLMLLSWSAAVDGRRTTLTAWAVLAAVALAVEGMASPDNVAMLAVLMASAAWAGHAWTESARSERSARETADAAQSVVAVAVAAALRAERLRIARDLHDVTSHALGVMVLQAGAAAAQRDRDPSRARACLAVIRQTGLHALTDLDRLVGLIDAGALGLADPARDEPTALADRLESLAERIRQTGTGVTLRIGQLPSEDQTTQVCHRVVQEALTNAIRHAPGSRVVVEVDSCGSGWRICVRDDGGPGPSRPGGGDAGFGLVGAAERVRGLDGEFEAGPGAAGGWVVLATIPDASAAARHVAGRPR